MEYWNAIIEFDHLYADDGVDDAILDAFSDWHAVVSSAMNRHVMVTLSIPAENMRQACRQALALLSECNTLPEACRIEVMKSDEYDRMNGFAPVPSLVSVTEASRILRVTRQRILQMLHDGTVNGIKVGNGWAMYRAEIDKLADEK